MTGAENEPSWKPIVDAVRRYYSFLSNDLGAIPSDCIVDAPGEGWPEISKSSLAGLEKTDAVIELLRHLPYINTSTNDNTQIAFSTSAIDYRAIGNYKVFEGQRSRFLPAGDKEFPPHVVVLTEEGEDYHGSLLLLDVENGKMLNIPGDRSEINSQCFVQAQPLITNLEGPERQAYLNQEQYQKSGDGQKPNLWQSCWRRGNRNFVL